MTRDFHRHLQVFFLCWLEIHQFQILFSLGSDLGYSYSFILILIIESALSSNLSELLDLFILKFEKPCSLNQHAFC